MNDSAGKLVKRKTHFTPKLYEIDMQNVVYNGHYFKWFDQARFEIILDLISQEEIHKTGISLMIAENHCEYKNFISYGDLLVLITTHRIVPAYTGRLRFEHVIIHTKKKMEMATGYSEMIVVDYRTKKLIKEMPDFIVERYLKLHLKND